MKSPLFLHSFLMLCFLIFFSACQKTVIVELPEHKPAMVLFTQARQGDRSLEVWLSPNASILDNRPLDSTWIDVTPPHPDSPWQNPEPRLVWVGDAQMALYENGQWLGDFRADWSLRRYVLNLPNGLNIKDNTYEIRAQSPSFPSVEARLPRITAGQISQPRYSIAAGRLNSDPDNWRYDVVEFDLQDPAGELNYYEIQLLQQPRDTAFAAFFSPLGLNSNDPLLSPGRNISLVLSDQGFNGRNYRISLLTNLHIEDSLYTRTKLVVKSISRDAYLFSKSYVALENAQFNPFAEPVILFTNVRGGRGLFNLFHEQEFWLVE